MLWINILNFHQNKLTGILNGIDTAFYDPEQDPSIAAAFSPEKLKGKAKCKQNLQAFLGLEEDPSAMIVAMVTRLVSHKGIDLVSDVFSEIMEMNTQFVLLGSGDWQYEKFFREAVMTYPGRVSATLAFDAPLSHRIYSGADIFLMPSRSEPCGLSQMIALRYGTIPVVRITGGLCDTIRDFGGEDGNGYNFPNIDAYDMLGAISRACADFQNKKTWTKRVKTAMACDYGWKQSANQYIALYKSL